MKKASVTIPINLIVGILILLPFFYVTGSSIMDLLDSLRYSNLEQKVSAIARTINLSLSQETSHVETIKGTEDTVMFQFVGKDISLPDFRQLYREHRLVDLVDCSQRYCLCIATLKREENGELAVIGQGLPGAECDEQDETFIFYSSNDDYTAFLEGIYPEFFDDFDDIIKIKCEVIQKPIMVQDGTFAYMHQNARYSKILSFSPFGEYGVLMEVVS